MRRYFEAGINGPIKQAYEAYVGISFAKGQAQRLRIAIMTHGGDDVYDDYNDADEPVPEPVPEPVVLETRRPGRLRFKTIMRGKPRGFLRK
jgi:hypothetical protein